ncbi:lysostaphin resistance A-like protein [Acidithiobacillus sp. IBUN Pt1247-S3]|uniref:CPBP family intramembrane glutamic endopeptidase n=1 Tax=Acidithiobacillus sp. IBUN Pt1247-S3 TaxID=3166642 RepID=UPI0034E3FE8E
MAIWRCLHPRFLLRDNVMLSLGLLGFAGISTLVVSTPRAATHMGSGAEALLLLMVAGLLVAYWRLRAENLLRLVPAFMRGLYGMFAFLLLLILLWGGAIVGDTGADWPGTLLLTSYLAFFGVVMGLLTPRVSLENRRWSNKILPVYLLAYPIIFVPAINHRFAFAPAFVAVPSALLLLALIFVVMTRSPAEWRDLWQQRARRSWRLSAPQWFAGMRRFWNWMPGQWSTSPILRSGASPLGVPAALLLLPLFPIGMTVMNILSTSQDPKHLQVMVPWLLGVWLIPAMAMGMWVSMRPFDWAYLALTGSAGGNRRAISRQMLWRYSRHCAALALAILPWPGVALMLLGYTALPIVLILFLLWLMFQVAAWIPLAAYGLGLRDGTAALFGLLSLAASVFFLGGSTHYWFYHHLIDVPFQLRLYALHVLLAILPIVAAFALAERRLRHSDWGTSNPAFPSLRMRLPGLLRPVRPDPVATQRVWGPWSAILLIVAFIAGQTLLAAGFMLMRGFWLGIRAGFVAAHLHQRLSTAAVQASIRHVSPELLAWVELLAYAGAALLCLWYLWRRIPIETWRRSADTGLAWCRAQSWQGYGVAVLTVLGMLVVAHLLFQLFPPPKHLSPKDLGLFDGLQMGGVLRYLVIFLMLIGAPFTEEILFRGALFAGLRQRLSVLWSASIVTLLFVLAHAPSKIAQLHYPPALILIALLAVALIWIRIRYRSLWPGMLLHGLWNGGGFLLAMWH